MGKIIEHKKPFSKKEWEFWEDRLGFFIQEFDDNIGAMARSNIESDEGDSHDHFLAGMSQGMWAIYTFIEDRMVEDDKNKDKFGYIKIGPGLHRMEAIKMIKKRKYVKSGKYKKRPVGKSKKNPIIQKVENRGRVGVIPSKEIMNVLNKFYKNNDKRTRITIDEIKSLLEKKGLIPKNIERRKVMKILYDRFFILTRKGLVIQSKKNGKTQYRLP